MKKIIAGVLFFCTINNLVACLRADQNRMFPVGMCSKGLVVVEMHLFRSERSTSEDDLKMTPEWNGYVFLTIYSKDNKRADSEIIDTLRSLTGRQYQETVKVSFMKGLSLAKKIPDLVIAQPSYISFCNYQTNCKTASLYKDTIQGKAFVKLSTGKKYPVSVLKDSLSIASNYLEYYNGFDYDSTGIKMKYVVQSLLINSVRKYQIENYQITIVHLGMGDLHEDEKHKEYKPDFAFTKIEESAFIEPVLHHGHGFDFLIME